MAAIDKTYTSSYSDYKAYYDWADNDKGFFEKYHKRLTDYFFKDLKEEDFVKEIPICNTTFLVDNYLIQHCPIKFVKDRLKEQYGNDTYERMRFGVEFIFKYDPYQETKFDIEYGPIGKHHNKPYDGGLWAIEIYGCNWGFDDAIGELVSIYEPCKGWFTTCIYVHTLKAAFRRLRNMDLIKGLHFCIQGAYVGEYIDIYTT